MSKASGDGETAFLGLKPTKAASDTFSGGATLCQ